MKKKNKNYLFIFLLLLLFGVSVGYAAISTTLQINGSSGIGTVKWDVHFENLKVTSGSVSATTAAAIDSTKLKVDYAVTLSSPGDFYEFTVDVVNAGSIAAKLSAAPTTGGLSTAQDVYANYTVTYSDGSAIQSGDTLAATSGKKTIKVRVEFDKNISASQLPTTSQTFNLTFSMNYVQAS